MLTKIRDSSKSLAFYVLGGIVVAVLIISFGTPSVGGLTGGGGDDPVAVRVGDAKVSSEELRQTLLLAGAQNIPVEQAKQFRFRERIIDDVIERELLAAEAHRLGVTVSEAEAEDYVAKSKIMLFGQPQVLSAAQKDGVFDFERFRRFLQFYGMTTRSFVDLQRRELAAARMREVLAGSVNVSLDQVQDRYVRQGNQVNLEYLRFPIVGQDDIEPTPEEVAAFVTANEAKVKAEYEQKKFLFDKVPKERKLRYLVVRWQGDDDAAKAAARKEAERLAAEVNRGKAFRDVAAQVRAAKPTTKGPRAESVRLGWRREGASGLAEEIEKKALASEDDKLVGPEQGSDGYYLVWVEGTREGALGFDDVKLELGEDLARKEMARARAEKAANAALGRARDAFAKDASISLKALFPAPEQKPESPSVPSADAPPEAQETGLFSRRGAVVEGIGVSPELAQSAFGLTAESPFAGPFEVAGSMVVIKLKERQQADMESFEKTKYDLRRGAVEAKGREVVDEWAREKCRDVRDKGGIAVSQNALVYEDGKPNAVPYEPCAQRSLFGF